MNTQKIDHSCLQLFILSKPFLAFKHFRFLLNYLIESTTTSHNTFVLCCKGISLELIQCEFLQHRLTETKTPYHMTPNCSV